MVALLHVATVNGGPFMSFGHGWWLSPVKRERKRSEPVKMNKKKKEERVRYSTLFYMKNQKQWNKILLFFQSVWLNGRKENKLWELSVFSLDPQKIFSPKLKRKLKRKNETDKNIHVHQIFFFFFCCLGGFASLFFLFFSYPILGWALPSSFFFFFFVFVLFFWIS